MKRTFSIIFTFLFLASCGKSGGGSSGMSALTEAEINSPVAPPQAQTFEVNARMTGFDRNQEDKVLQAFDKIKQVIGTDEFKRRVLGFSYKGRKQYNNNNGLSNAQIYKKILEGSEMLTPGKNNAMDIQLATYFDPSIVIGYTQPNIDTIFLNTKYLNASSFQINEVAMNITHEWLHKLGFKHDFQNTPGRSSSVPYAIGYIMRSLTANLP